jgi:hypothetical protein
MQSDLGLSEICSLDPFNLDCFSVDSLELTKISKEISLSLEYA